MKKFLFLSFLVCLTVFPAMAQDNEISPNINKDATVQSSNGSRALGTVLYSLDVEAPTADNGLLGCEFAQDHIWVTGRASGVGIHQLYKFDQKGNLVAQYNQGNPPVGGSWGWRDLAWDGTYLYAGEDVTNPNKIAVIDPANGNIVGLYGAYGSMARAVAYHEPTDSFFIGNFGGSIYQCFRDGTQKVFADALTAKYGAAYCKATDKIWWWDQVGPTAHEWDPNTGTYTGVSFLGAGGIAGGAGIYVNDDLDDGVNKNIDGIWKFIGLQQGTPDSVQVYDLDVAQLPLVGLPSILKDPGPVGAGGNWELELYASAKNANRKYLMLFGVSGVSPGTPLPGGKVLPLNWDVITSTLLGIGLGFGSLDGDGEGKQLVKVPPKLGLTADLTLYGAYTLGPPGIPFDFVSNPEEILIQK